MEEVITMTLVSELTIPQLNEWVAKALGWKIRLWGAIPVWFDPAKENRYRCHVSQWNPSENWAQGGPILDREKIGVHWDSFLSIWRANKDESDPSRRTATGKTYLVAAMRAFVASKYGDEVPE